MGLSIVAYVVLAGYRVWLVRKRAANVELIAEAAYVSSKPGNEAIALHARVFAPTVAEFFRAYGTTEHGYKDFDDPRMYAGYVSYNGSDEFLAIIALSREGCVVCGFRPPERYGEDVLSLMKKKMFFDKTLQSVRGNS